MRLIEAYGSLDYIVYFGDASAEGAGFQVFFFLHTRKIDIFPLNMDLFSGYMIVFGGVFFMFFLRRDFPYYFI